jgi:phytoene dehydrogenase-like protein
MIMSTSENRTDAIVIGAGHNGLSCAGYLARGGLKVTVLERRDVIGGAALTEEFHPGFRNSVFSYLVSLLDQQVIRDLDLFQHGLELLQRPGGSLSILPGDHLYLPRDPASAQQALARFSAADAAAYPEFEDLLESLGDAIRVIATQVPPNFGGGLSDLWKVLGQANVLRKLPADRQADLAELMTMSIGDFLDRWFESDPIKGLYGFEGIIGNFVDPYAQGSAYVLLHHIFGQVDGRTGAWAYAKGGMGAITQAMARYCRSQGVDIRTNAAVSEVILDKGVAKGVVLEDGTALHAPVVAANCHPQILFGQLIDPALTPDRFAKRVAGWRSESATFRMNVALSELPKFDTVDHDENGLTAMKNTIDIAPSLSYIRAAYDDARMQGWSKAPVVSMCIPTLMDDSLAPPGGHVMSLFCQHFRRHLPDGRSWDDVREEVADHIIDTVAAHSPNFRQAIVGRQINSPLDIERKLNMVGGDIFHGTLHLDQIFALRPAPGHADHRMPVPGVYLCGSGAHPGGGVSGIPGRNAAQEILKDVKRRKVG